VGLLGVLEGKLLGGTKEEVLRALRDGAVREESDVFLGKVYEAGKSS
jgi:hypothetical protein